MTTITRRPKALAVPDGWKTSAACSRTDPDLFFSDLKRQQAQARAVCVGCPVIAECLAEHQQRDKGVFRWGIGGGLTAVQRRALEVEERLGSVPNVAVARRLLRGRWLGRLLELDSSCESLGAVTEGLREFGALVDPVTVRVALWWAGRDGGRLPKRREADSRDDAVWLREDHGDLIRGMREDGLTLQEVAAYLGVPMATTIRTVKQLQRRDGVDASAAMPEGSVAA